MHPSKVFIPPASGNERTGDLLGDVQSLWAFFDRVYCISLESRPDRRAEAAAQFARVGLAERVEYVLVEKHPTNPEQGIYESHLACMAKGVAQGAERILIFEDDVIFDRFSPQRLQDSIGFLAANPDWRVFFFGCMVRHSKKISGYPVLRVGYRSLTHALVIHRPFAQEMLSRHPWRGIAYDDFLRDLQCTCMYAAYPSFAFQSNSPSDNDVYLPLDRFRRLCGGLTGLQKFDEWYHRHKALIISLHLLALVVLASLIQW